MDNPFDDLARELPDGAFWPTGKWFKKLLKALVADRARAGANINELPSEKGRFFNAQAGGNGTATVATPPLTIEDASAKDKMGTAHPGRVRVYNGKLGGLTPAEMKVPDSVLPDGTDNHCYLTMQSGTNYVRGKVQVAAATGQPSAASVYRVAAEEPADGTYAYLTIGDVNFDGTKLVITQEATGNQQLFVIFSRDGSIISQIWNPTTA